MQCPRITDLRATLYTCSQNNIAHSGRVYISNRTYTTTYARYLTHATSASALCGCYGWPCFDGSYIFPAFRGSRTKCLERNV